MRISDWSSDVCSSDLVAGSYVASGRSRSGTYRRISYPGRCATEDGRLWFHSVLTPDVPGSFGTNGLAGLRPIDDCSGLHLAGCAGAERHEEANRLFFIGAYAHRYRSEDRRGGTECVSTFISRW